jgi:ABC-type bacteriocin/lantibiotic exporter with double-glycine peptidase domain
MQQLITHLVLILLTIIAIVVFNAKLFLLLFIILMPPVIGVFYLIKKRLGAVRANTRITSEGSLQHLQEALSGYVESNIYNKNDYFLQRYLTFQQDFNRYIAANLIAQSMPARIIEIFALLGLFMLIAINRWTGNTDSAAIITVGAFMAAAYKIIPGIVKILNVLGQMNTYAFTVDDLAETMPAMPPQQNPLGIKKLDSICVKNIHFRYNDQPVLDNVNFHIQRGDFIGISGASGKGKTTILNLLLGFLEPQAGEIIINENHSDKPARQQYWDNISYVKQQPFMIRDTILQNIVLDTGIVNEQRLQKAIHISGLTEVINKFPEKLDKIVAENGKNISGGQRQRIALARALYKDADLIILDEPFNELDEASEQSILTNLKEFTASGKMIILITHHTKSLSFCSKTVSLDA